LPPPDEEERTRQDEPDCARGDREPGAQTHGA
jgi:hypothetical protein